MDINTPNEYVALYNDVDVIYADIPWRRGYDVFMKKVYGDSIYPSYKDFIVNLNELITKLNKPTIIVAGDEVKNLLKKPYDKSKITINYNNSYSTAYSYGIDVHQFNYTVDLIEYLSLKYNVLGNFCCGYGYTGEIFLNNGKHFIMSDVNDGCISSIKNNILI